MTPVLLHWALPIAAAGATLPATAGNASSPASAAGGATPPAPEGDRTKGSVEGSWQKPPRLNEALFVAFATRFGYAFSWLHKDEEPTETLKVPPTDKLVSSRVVPDADLEVGITERAVDLALYGGLAGGAQNGALGSIGFRFEWGWLPLGDHFRVFTGVRAGRFGLFQQQDQDLSGYEASLEAGTRIGKWEGVRVFAAFTERWMAYDRDASGLSMLNEHGASFGLGVRFQVSEWLDWSKPPTKTTSQKGTEQGSASSRGAPSAAPSAAAPESTRAPAAPSTQPSTGAAPGTPLVTPPAAGAGGTQPQERGSDDDALSAPAEPKPIAAPPKQKTTPGTP